ncbi:hypothetical protein [Phenylobacterium sp.]|jgi:multisubunit Na+/H+ antiporter MnhG subunit|uniref:hypothetical protein n=1 Tax=Phenylobacterium sp. TaxID=1871053 RepID=UPI002F4131B3
MKRPLRPNERGILIIGAVVVLVGALRLSVRAPDPLMEIAVFLGAGLLLLAGFAWAWTHGLFGGSDD